MNFKAIAGLIFPIGYFVMGLLQLSAIMAYTNDVLDLHWIIAAPLAFVLSYIPVIGSGLGIFAAMKVWNWSFILSFLLFCWPLVLYTAAFILSSFEVKFKKSVTRSSQSNTSSIDYKDAA